jgi:hypothetical protein
LGWELVSVSGTASVSESEWGSALVSGSAWASESEWGSGSALALE